MADQHEVLVRDFGSAAAGYFGSVRIPATMIAGTSLGALFTFSRTDTKGKTQAELFVLRSYHIFVLTSFALAFSTVIISTSATVAMLHGRFDPRAESAYALLRREFDFEFTMTRWMFLVALFLFIGGITNRVIMEFDLLDKDKRFHLIALLSTMVSVASNLLSYINRTLYCWKSLWVMTVHVVELLAEEAFTKKSPLQILSLLSAAVAALAMMKVALFSSEVQEGSGHTIDRKKKL